MPANPKYLTTSTRQRVLKITAAILGGYLVSTSFHLALAAWFDQPIVIITSAFTGFLLWGSLMVVTFLARNGWRIWGWYVLITAVLLGLTALGLHFNH
ncbi:MULTISPECIES: hypothetical protein [unclassified Flavobacterium]|uniref:hypothetical protein n=1 Tax=unclassified Flavobacterium TaxID=196869 RepID=UPI001F140984|nr:MULTISPECIES: hypothetical protein [unclassified Flavobacterium]UMY66616.1 hypothetical protein MKO97_04315 [Flavobacterium sp. HJ-32-4]